MRLRDAAVGIALGERANDARETGGNNRGPAVEKYLRSCGISIPAAWCMAFVFWSAEKAAEHLQTENPLRNVPLRALVASLIDTARRREWIIPASVAEPGDIVAFQWSSGNHVGFLLEPPPVVFGAGRTHTGPFWTLEGNTDQDVGLDNEERQREGDGVFVKTRRATTGRVHFIRWDEGRHGPPPP